jgi:tRNA threonylcarbamoyladenosine modification (KEOPS) complex Cgi121 subunit
VLKYLADAGQYVEISGFKNVKVEKTEQLLRTLRGGWHSDTSVQFFNANLVATWEHVYFAVLDALMAFNTKRNISKSLAVEIMLYASTQRQIKKAIGLIGVKCGCSDLAVVVVSKHRKDAEAAVKSISKYFHREPDEVVLAFSPAKRKIIREAFGITENELNAVTKQNDADRALVDLLAERMALLSTRL